MKLFSSLPVALAVAMLPTLAVRAADVPSPACMAHAGASLDALTHGDYVGARKDFSVAMAGKASAAGLERVWKQLQGTFGTYQSHGALRHKVLGGHSVVAAKLSFANMPFEFVAACDARDRIAAYRFVPVTDLSSTAVQAHVDAGGVRVSPLDVPTPVGLLRGALTLPAGSGPFPAVVLVAGSGANDMDETVGHNKPFRDIADGLARLGIASLRYDKRTLDYPEKWSGKSAPVIDAEVTDDAVTAAHLLAQQKAVDPRRVFVIGHSLGAMMAPRIGERDPQLAGLVLMAAPARRILDVLEQQSRYLSIKAGESPAAAAQGAQEYVAEQKLLAAVAPGQPVPPGKFSGVPQSYWLSWSRVDPVAGAKRLSMPMLILQGGSDFQVRPMQDFARWKRELAGRSHTAFHLYPGLNHLFMPAGRTAAPAEYYKASGHVDVQVIGDIARWIKAQAPALDRGAISSR